MQPSDFGVDIDALPKLVLDEDAGRKMLAKLNMVSTFRDYVDMGKRTFFYHYLERHLDVRVPEVKKGRDKFIRVTDDLMRDHELVWTQVSRMVDRHVFLMVTAHASVEANVLDSDDKEMLHCNAYTDSYDMTVSASVLGMEIADALLYRLNRNKGSLDVIDSTLKAKESLNMIVGRFEKIANLFLIAAMDNKEYKGAQTKPKRD